MKWVWGEERNASRQTTAQHNKDGRLRAPEWECLKFLQWWKNEVSFNRYTCSLWTTEWTFFAVPHKMVECIGNLKCIFRRGFSLSCCRVELFSFLTDTFRLFCGVCAKQEDEMIFHLFNCEVLQEGDDDECRQHSRVMASQTFSISEILIYLSRAPQKPS